MEQNPAQALVRRLTSRIRDTRMRYGISSAARAEMRRERRTLSDADLPIDRTIRESLAWIGRAQDYAPSADAGVARHYCLITGWAPPIRKLPVTSFPLSFAKGWQRGTLSCWSGPAKCSTGWSGYRCRAAALEVA